MLNSFAPPFLKDPLDLDLALKRKGFAVLDAVSVTALSQCNLDGLDILIPSWDDLPIDNHLKDGGHYRSRRHTCYVVDGSFVQKQPHRSHWQPVEYNALHGGLERWFEPLSDVWMENASWIQLLRWLAVVASEIKGVQRWYVEAHQFRIDTADGIGRPTPEGAHRDGVDLVAVFLVNRCGIKGGETRVFDSQGPKGERFTLTQAWSVLILDDSRVVHESTPIQPEGSHTTQSHRDTLVVTFRSGQFQEARQ